MDEGDSIPFFHSVTHKRTNSEEERKKGLGSHSHTPTRTNSEEGREKGF
jgi:hypothetical protein